MSADRDLRDIAAIYRVVPESWRDAIEEAAHLVLRHTRACGGIGQTTEEKRAADNAVAALPARVRRLADEAVLPWCVEVCALWMTAVYEHDMDPDDDNLETIVGDDPEMWDVQRLVLVSSRVDRVSLACSVQSALEEVK